MSVPMSYTESNGFFERLLCSPASTCYKKPQLRCSIERVLTHLGIESISFSIRHYRPLALSLETAFYSNLDPLRLPPTKTLLNLCKISRTIAVWLPSCDAARLVRSQIKIELGRRSWKRKSIDKSSALLLPWRPCVSVGAIRARSDEI
jgi:hypothetical protein